jgi:hypothetical protein
MATETPGKVKEATLPCRLCFWSADLTRKDERVWCSHAVHHGWMTDKAACDGKAFQTDLRP